MRLLASTLVLSICACSVYAQIYRGPFPDVRYETEDSIIIEAADTIEGREKRDTSSHTRVGNGRQTVVWTRQAEAFGLECETELGKRGTCKTFKDCYPLFKVSEVSGWVMGHYDTCSFISEENEEVFGVCCTDPVETPPQQEPDLQRLMPQKNILYSWPLPFPQQLPALRQIPFNWPPQIPTHPPNHTAATHPPYFGMITTKPTTTTMKPSVPTKPTYKPPVWPPPLPTHPPMTTTTRTTTDSDVIEHIETSPGSGGCGVKNGARQYWEYDQERIVGGHNADLNEWPWIVALFNGGRQFCGGSLIDNQHILSAAHCVAHMTSWDVARLTAKLGDHNIRTTTETQHVEKKIKRVVRHRGFDMRTLYHDIAVLTVSTPVTFTRNIRPICLPTSTRAYSGLTATVIGWGSLRENGPQPSILQEVTIPIWSNQECRLKYGSAAPGGIVEHMICAGRASMDSCSGDSGGPLMVNEGGKWVQIGVVSWGIGCGKGQYPGVYTRTTAFMPWISKNIAV